MAAKQLRGFYQGTNFTVPMEGGDRGNARRFETKRWDASDTPEPIKKIATIMVSELNKRFQLEGTPDANTLLSVKLNPTIDKASRVQFPCHAIELNRNDACPQASVFNSSQRDAMNATYDLIFDKAADFYFEKRQHGAEEAAARPTGSPSPTAAAARPRSPGANVATGNILADADAAFTLDLNDGPANTTQEQATGGSVVDSRAVEKAAFQMMDKSG